MTPSTEPDQDSGVVDQGPLGPAWRERMHTLQEQALGAGSSLVSCPAPLDAGGLGRHLREILDAQARAGVQSSSLSWDENLPAPGAAGRLRRTALAPLGRVSRAWRMWARSVEFDERAARGLRRSERLLAFNGTAGAQFARARREWGSTLSLIAANSHFSSLLEKHELAHRQYPVERPWVTHLLARNLREYALAERIVVSSGYVRDSFLERGFDESALDYFPLTPHPRFQPPADAPGSPTFDIVYLGSLTVHKGVPLLLDALRLLPAEDIRLVLIGGWGTRGMRRHIEQALARDTRVSVAPGDPLERLQRASLCVHPAYEDGFAYAPAEALACGVPVIVSEDTGMRDLVRPGRDGVVVPTGSREALAEAIDAAYRGELLHA
jgi:glycosyltransferase involved in cell wall biosynthesis